METLVSLLLVILILLLCSTIKPEVLLADQNDEEVKVVLIGLVVDLSSIEGKILQTSFSLALSDFYLKNNGYQTRVTVLSRDSEGDPLLALAAVMDLVKTTQVEAIIVGAQSLHEAKLLAAISEKAKVPMISPLVPSSLSLEKYDHFIQITHDTTSEAKGIARLVRDFDWESIVVIYEDVDEWREGLQILVENFQDDRIQIERIVSFVERGEEDYMMNRLVKLNSSRTSVFVVHMSEFLVYRLFRSAEKLGMMEEGYVWILTARTMNHFHYFDRFAIRSMQGVIGFRSYIQESKELESFTSRLRKLMVDYEKSWMETEHFSVVISVWAHDIACIIATAVEEISLRPSGVASYLLETIKHSRFKGLSHDDIQIIGKTFLLGTFEIVNIVGTGERRIGLWSYDHFRGRKHIMTSSINELDTIIWPGGSGKVPKHRFLVESSERKLLRILVSSRNRFPDLVAVRPEDSETGLISVTGFCIEVFKTSISPFNYGLEFIPYDGINYDNLAYEFSTQRDKYDAAVGDITITANRSLYVDFTLPYTDLGIGVLELIKKRESMWTFFEPLEMSLWLASGSFFILTGIVVWLVERTANPEFQGSWGQQLCTVLWFGFSTLVFAHREKLEKMSSKFLVVVWVFVVLILTSSYNANLTSTKTISHIQFKQQMVLGSSIIKSMKPNSTNAVEDYAQVLRDGILDYVVDEIPYLNAILEHYPDAFEITSRETITNGFGFMFQRGSGLAHNVSREIAKLRSSGMLKEIEKRWFPKMDSFTIIPDSSDNDDATKRLTIHELGGLFIIAGVAHALVLVVHIFQSRREILCVLRKYQLFNKLQSLCGFYK